ncbi:MAG: iron donor protein CyaY [Alphaproteobacteria bacterium]|nr:iron donor protein CyaY [Alphaproteobacteria bacterium]
MDDTTFERLAGEVLQNLAERIEDAADDLDVELLGGVLTVKAASGTFVVNKHAPLKQLWLSSPVSGASHYGLEPATGAWRSTRGGGELFATLGTDLSRCAGRPIALD